MIVVASQTLKLTGRVNGFSLPVVTCVACGVVGRDESFDSLARHDTTTLQRAVMSPIQMPRPQQQQLTTMARQAPDSNVTRLIS